MGRLAESTGLSAALGHGIASRFPDAGVVGLTMVFTGVAVVMSETASNTAAANIIVPTAIAVSKAAGVDPLEPALGATLGASLGFMMPISTPPNAIVYSSGYIPLGAMVRNGLVLDVVGYFIIIAGVLGLDGLLAVGKLHVGSATGTIPMVTQAARSTIRPGSAAAGVAAPAAHLVGRWRRSPLL